MGIVRDLYYAKKMSAGLQLPAPSSAALVKRMFLAKHVGGADETLTGSMVTFTGDVRTSIRKLLVDLDSETGITGCAVWCVGKNFLDNAHPGAENAQNIVWGNSSLTGGADGSFVLPAGTYTASASESMSGIYVTDANNSNIKVVYNNTKSTFTLSEAKAVKVIFYKIGATDMGDYKYQLEVGSTDTDYEAFQGGKYTVDWTDEAGTLTGGTMEIVSGVLTDSASNVYQLTPQDVEAVVGENFVWSDAGDVEVTVRNAISALPDEYKQVLGYSCNNNCYWPITGFKLRGSDTVRISFSVTSACNVFGCYQGVDATDNYDLYVSVSAGSKYLRYGNGTYASYWSASDLGNRFNVVFTPTGTDGMPEDSTWTAKTFEAENDMLIGATTTTGSSSKLVGNVYGPVVVDGRLYLIPCERLADNELGYYDALHDVFYEPVGTPTSLGYV